MGTFGRFSSGGGGSYNVTPAVTTIGYLSLELGPGVCDEKTPLVKDWAYYINWVVADQILLSAQKQTQNRLETQIRLKKQVGTRANAF